MSVGSPEVSPRGEGDPATSPGCPDHHADPFDPDKPRKVRCSSLSCLAQTLTPVDESFPMSIMTLLRRLQHNALTVNKQAILSTEAYKYLLSLS